MEISTYEVILMASIVNSNGLKSKLILKQCVIKTGMNGSYFLLIESRKKPGLFDASVNQFSELMRIIKHTNIPVKTTETVIQETCKRRTERL
jgi:hypothetical protein